MTSDETAVERISRLAMGWAYSSARMAGESAASAEAQGLDVAAFIAAAFKDIVASPEATRRRCAA